MRERQKDRETERDRRQRDRERQKTVSHEIRRQYGIAVREREREQSRQRDCFWLSECVCIEEKKWTLFVIKISNFERRKAQSMSFACVCIGVL